MSKNWNQRMSLADKVALVTGAAQGLGRYISQGLAEAGADIIVADVNFKGAESSAKEIEKAGRKALPVEVDITIVDSIEHMVKKALEVFGKIDCLINNAGVNVHKPFTEINFEDFDFVNSVNFRGGYFVSQIVSREMIRRKEGKIINISSAAGFLLRPGIPNSVYAATKAAIIMLTKAMAEELAPYNIYVNAVAPGYFITPLVKDRIENSTISNKILELTPLRRFGRPEEIADPVIFLASDASNFITGQTIFVDGGRTVL